MRGFLIVRGLFATDTRVQFFHSLVISLVILILPYPGLVVRPAANA